MQRADLSRALEPFLSRLALEHVGKTKARAPWRETFECALLWTDVSGFTPLVERLSVQGSGGAERLSAALSAHFGRIIEICETYGGDLLFLAGDAALCLFRPGPDESLSSAVRRGEMAARQVLAELDGARPRADIVLRMRITLSAGRVSAYWVGGVADRWLFAVAGPAIASIGAMASSATAGQLALTGHALALLEASGSSGVASPSLDEHAHPSPTVQGASTEGLLSQVPPNVAALLQAGYTEFLAEFRTMTVVFADLSGLGADWEATKLHEVVTAIQTTVNAFEATLYQLVQDDKGTVAVIVFGLPGLSHEDDAVRAILFANKLGDRLGPIIGEVSRGISTGPLFCGPCGLSRRSQYAVYGRAMNRAARLMASAAGGTVLDEPTQRAASTRLDLGDARQLSVKGVDGPVVAFFGDRAHTRAIGPTGMVGRHEERNLLARELDAFSERGQAGIVVLEGPPGIGKTSLLAELRRVCRARGLRVAWGNADLVETRTPLFALRSILRELLGIDPGASSVDVTRSLGAVLRALGEDLDLLPLVREALGVDPMDTELTRQMIAAVRAENRNRLLGAIVARAARERPVVAVLDDLHWCDAATGALLPELIAVPGVLWAFALRTEGAGPEILRGLSDRMTRVTLRGLDELDIAAIAAGALGVEEVPASLTKLLIDRAAGNPLYSRELVIMLQERGHVQVRSGRCHLAESFGHATMSDLPDSLAALIKSRIDKLPQAAQVTLRVASVVGQSFERRVLADVLQVTAPSFDSETLTESLDVLERAGFLHGETAVANERRFTFGHATVQSVAHNLILPGQLAALHHATARALERHAPRAFARLSHHWVEASGSGALSPILLARKVTKYSIRAAREALDGFANEDAIALYERAILSHKIAKGDREVDLRRSSLHAWRSRAHYSLTQVSRSRIDLEYAHRFAGFPEVGTGTKALMKLVALAMRYIATRSTGAQATEGLSRQARSRDLAALAILGEWMVLDFWEARLVEAAAKAFLGYNLAAKVRSSPLAAEAIARLGYVVGLTPLRFMAEGELVRAVELAEKSGELQARVSSRVFLGMHYTLVGRLPDAARHLEIAQEPANKLGGGLWRHRARFMLGEAMLCLGHFKEAGDAFAEAAQLSVGAERPVVGLSTCMRALAIARLGRFEEALALIDGPMGLPIIDPNRCLPLQRFTSLGIKAEILGHMGCLSEAEEIVRGEARALSDAGGGYACSVFFAGLHGYAGVLSVYLNLRSRMGHSKVRSAQTLSEETWRAQKRLRAFSRIYPAARPRLDLLTGSLHVLDGRARQGRAALRRSLETATAMKMPYEQALAHYWLSRASDDPPARRGEALRICRDVGMEHEESLILAEATQKETTL